MAGSGVEFLPRHDARPLPRPFPVSFISNRQRRPLPRVALLLVASVLVSSSATSAPVASGTWEISSPAGNQQLAVTLADGRLSYQVNRIDDGRQVLVIAPSPLGLDTDAGTFAEDLRLVSVTRPTEVDESFDMDTGKQRTLRNHYTARSLRLAHADDQPWIVDFRAYDDGVAFRYRLPAPPKTGTRIAGEHTGFRLAAEGKAWMQPFQAIAAWAPAYEDYYTNGTPLGEDAPRPEGWAFPALFETKAGWILLTEADLDRRNYGAHLDATVRDRTYLVRLPLAESARGIGAVAPTVTAPWAGAWRLVIDGPSLATIAESNLVTEVSRPPAVGGDFSWVRPGRATWSWWSDHRSPRDYDAITPFIDLAAEWGWEYSLIDANWNRMEHGSIEQLLAYAKQRGVGLFLGTTPAASTTKSPRNRATAWSTARPAAPSSSALKPGG